MSTTDVEKRAQLNLLHNMRQHLRMANPMLYNFQVTRALLSPLVYNIQITRKNENRKQYYTITVQFDLLSAHLPPASHFTLAPARAHPSRTAGPVAR